MRKLKQLQRPSTATAFHSLCLTVDNYASSGWLTTPVTKDARAAFGDKLGGTENCVALSPPQPARQWENVTAVPGRSTVTSLSFSQLGKLS